MKENIMKYRLIEIINASNEFIDQLQLGQVTVQGWVRSNRSSKAGISFITLNDGSCLKSLQVIVPNTIDNYQDQILKLSKDCSITAVGQLKLNPRSDGKQELELLATEVIVHGIVDDASSYPMSLKKHSLEHLREYPHLRVRTNLISAVMRIRNTISLSIHNFLQAKGFLWIHTPIITAIDCEGAGEMFSFDFFDKRAFLTVSGQLNVESYCLGLSKVYTFGPTFRAENSNTTRHLCEFWMIEPEIAFANLNDIVSLAADLLKSVCKSVLEHNELDLEFLSKHSSQDLYVRANNIINDDFAQIDYNQAIEMLLASNKKFEQPVVWGCDLSSEHERYICEELMNKPVVIKNYPKDIKAFYMRVNDDDKTVAAMDILVPGIGEIMGGSQREERLEQLLKQMKSKNIKPQSMQWYLDLRRYGSVVHSGFGLGLERLVSYITNVSNIRDTIPFPRTPHNLEY